MSSEEEASGKRERFRKHVRKTHGSLEKRMFNRGRIDRIEKNYFVVKFPEKNYVNFNFNESVICTPPLVNVNVRGFFEKNPKGNKNYYLVEGLSGLVYYKKKD